MHDPVNSPSHYADGNGIECIEAIEACMGIYAFKGFLRGNCMKYLWRYEQKNGLEDLRKCKWYLERLIGVLEGEAALREKIQQASREAMEALETVAPYDPDDYMLGSGCTDGFCPMPNVRQGPSEPMFEAVN